MNDVGGGMRAEQCSKQDIKQSGNTITINSVCNYRRRRPRPRARSSPAISIQAYTVKMKSKREGGPAIPGMPAETSMTIDAEMDSAPARPTRSRATS